MTDERAERESPQCRLCEADAVVLLQDRFPFCREHYMDVVTA